MRKTPGLGAADRAAAPLPCPPGADQAAAVRPHQATPFHCKKDHLYLRSDRPPRSPSVMVDAPLPTRIPPISRLQQDQSVDLAIRVLLSLFHGGVQGPRFFSECDLVHTSSEKNQLLRSHCPGFLGSFPCGVRHVEKQRSDKGRAAGRARPAGTCCAPPAGAGGAVTYAASCCEASLVQVAHLYFRLQVACGCAGSPNQRIDELWRSLF